MRGEFKLTNKATGSSRKPQCIYELFRGTNLGSIETKSKAFDSLNITHFNSRGRTFLCGTCMSAKLFGTGVVQYLILKNASSKLHSKFNICFTFIILS